MITALATDRRLHQVTVDYQNAFSTLPSKSIHQPFSAAIVPRTLSANI